MYVLSFVHIWLFKKAFKSPPVNGEWMCMQQDAWLDAIISDITLFLYQLAQDRPHNGLHFPRYAVGETSYWKLIHKVL